MAEVVRPKWPPAWPGGSNTRKVMAMERLHVLRAGGCTGGRDGWSLGWTSAPGAEGQHGPPEIAKLNDVTGDEASTARS